VQDRVGRECDFQFRKNNYVGSFFGGQKLHKGVCKSHHKCNAHAL